MRGQRHGQYLSKAAEFQSRAVIATDWQLKATFKDLARFYRQMAKYLEQTEQYDPKERYSLGSSPMIAPNSDSLSSCSSSSNVNRRPNLTPDRRPILTLLGDEFWR